MATAAGIYSLMQSVFPWIHDEFRSRDPDHYVRDVAPGMILVLSGLKLTTRGHECSLENILKSVGYSFYSDGVCGFPDHELWRCQPDAPPARDVTSLDYHTLLRAVTKVAVNGSWAVPPGLDDECDSRGLGCVVRYRSACILVDHDVFKRVYPRMAPERWFATKGWVPHPYLLPPLHVPDGCVVYWKPPESHST
jgi:hypothetical protein